MTGVIPTKWTVAQYWASSPLGCDVFAPQLSIEDPCCFVCGWFAERWKNGCSTRKAWERARLERAHIVPAGVGGSNEPDNIILLCAPCHEESPDWFEPWEMAIWISQRAERPSREMEQANAWIEALHEVPQFIEVLGRFAGMDDGTEVVLGAMRKALAGAVVHGSGVGLRKATMVAITRRAMRELEGARYLPSLPSRPSPFRTATAEEVPGS